MSKQLSLVLLTVFSTVFYLGFVTIGFVKAQEPNNGNNSQTLEQSSTTTTPTTSTLELTGAGWLEKNPEPAGISISALPAVNCATMPPPVIGYEISKGQDSNDITPSVPMKKAAGTRRM